MSICKECKKELENKKFGPKKIYCSKRCSQRRWTKNHPEQVKKKRREYKISKYGWTLSDLHRELERQNNSCYGCLKLIDEKTARIDHCHKENRVRGLLCDSCNWTLGHVFDRPDVLRRLMAYLDRKRESRLIYLIGALKNSKIPYIGNTLRKEGFDVMDEWFTPGEHADTNWQAYEKLRGRSYKEALRGRSATNNFLFDRSYLDLSDIAILIMPAGKSAMLELGYSKGRGKKAFIFLDGQEPDRYDIMPGFADKIFKTEQEMLEELRQLKS